MKKRSRFCTGLLLMNAERRDQNSMPVAGVESIAFPEIDTNLFGVGLFRSLYG